ncbi:hypothetical protein [Candidatus Methylocalor cossyra]|uniref:Uncharacterized protein n=1 Tax=Candidatus Methylocalor cossyra TaxID=3108543 RepID=A0ABM9NN62_9GAMM
MTKFRTWYAIVLFTCLSSIALYAPTAAADPRGGTYLLTIKDATTGAFASRGVITLHGDHTLSAIDSGQGGPDFFFSSQQGVWKPDSKGGAVGRTLDFNFPPSPGVARLDYTFQFGSDDKDVTGTITLTTFPLQGDPLGEGGTVVGTFTFDGKRVQP